MVVITVTWDVYTIIPDGSFSGQFDRLFYIDDPVDG
jgi:hypothetical protein